MSILLDDAERDLLGSISAKLQRIQDFYQGSRFEEMDVSALIREIGGEAHRLHMALKRRGHEPKHHGYMIENRGMAADHKEFYMHMHPVEDLLAFIKDEHANDDPEDQTIGHEFSLTVYSRRWGHDDTYALTRTETGWEVEFTHSGPCDKAGRPYLYSNFANDMVHYPADLEGYLEWLWMRASEQGLSHETVQKCLDELAEWVKATSRAAPSGGQWEGF